MVMLNTMMVSGIMNGDMRKMKDVKMVRKMMLGMARRAVIVGMVMVRRMVMLDIMMVRRM